jgi:CheY-like chemotaxis protein
MQYALKRHNSGEARILPIIIRPVIWEQTPFSHLQVLPRDGKPLTRRTNRDEAYLDIARGIESAVKELKKGKKNFPIFVPPNLKDSEVRPHIAAAAPPVPRVVRPNLKDSEVRPHILIVDDEQNIHEVIKLGMRYEGFNCSSVADGEQALNFLQVHQPDLIILDRGLPDIDGVVVCQRLRANPTTRDIPILMLTGQEELQDRIIGLDAGADDYMTKPYEFDELVARVRAILRRQQRSTQGEQLT